MSEKEENQEQPKPQLTDTVSITFDVFGLVKGVPQIHFDEATEERNF